MNHTCSPARKVITARAQKGNVAAKLNNLTYSWSDNDLTFGG